MQNRVREPLKPTSQNRGRSKESEGKYLDLGTRRMYSYCGGAGY